MFNCGLWVVQGSVKMRLKLVQLLDFQKMIPSLRLVEQASWMILTGLENSIEFIRACFQLPKKTAFVYFHIQKKILQLPFLCLHKIYSQFVNTKKPFIPKITVQRASPVQILTGERYPSPDQILAACKEIRTSAIKTISKKESSMRVFDYRQQLDMWRLASENRTEEIYKIEESDKELMKTVASSLRCLRALKNKRDAMHSFYNKKISAMIDDGTVSGKKLLAMKNKIKQADAVILDKKNTCLDLLSHGQLEGLSESECICPDKNTEYRGLPKENMQKVLNLVAEENSMLRNQLSGTVKKLEDILNISININSEVVLLNEKFANMNSVNDELSILQEKFEEERKFLIAVQADRDIMKNKLMTLETLIQEEEDFLGDSKLESGYDDSDMGSLATDYDLDFSSSSR